MEQITIKVRTYSNWSDAYMAELLIQSEDSNIVHRARSIGGATPEIAFENLKKHLGGRWPANKAELERSGAEVANYTL